jgi:hypothetical protein
MASALALALSWLGFGDRQSEVVSLEPQAAPAAPANVIHPLHTQLMQQQRLLQQRAQNQLQRSVGASHSISVLNITGVERHLQGPAATAGGGGENGWNFVADQQMVVAAELRRNMTDALVAAFNVSASAAALLGAFMRDAAWFGFDKAVAGLALHRDLLAWAG